MVCPVSDQLYRTDSLPRIYVPPTFYAVRDSSPVQKGSLLDPASLTNILRFTPSYTSLRFDLTLTSNLCIDPSSDLFAWYPDLNTVCVSNLLHSCYMSNTYYFFHFITLTISGSDAGRTKTNGSQTSGVRDILGEVHNFRRTKEL